ncbi:MAG: hypothetical protein B7Z73_19920 [Planctomycetia bacterium 21-64-5]|nr:MAG: hypothetical protein B7Z73_19920 [Planctomycetia bacterium 21-64-5]
MLNDIVMTKRLGFNMIRKHVKVEPDRWYHLADSVGVLVWQDMPSGENRTPAAQAEFRTELHRMIDALRDHPSIVMWVPFNEGWGQFHTRRITAWITQHDPTRLVNSATGWTDHGVGDVVDIHAYPGPAMPPVEKFRAAVLGEFGGLGLPLDGHTWLPRNNWGYRTFADTFALRAAYGQLLDQLRLLEAQGLAAAVYTQTTDVEVEVNGLMTYDRAIVKQDPAAAAAEAARLFGPMPVVRPVVPTSEQTPQTWRYTTTSPGESWTQPGFDDAVGGAHHLEHRRYLDAAYVQPPVGRARRSLLEHRARRRRRRLSQRHARRPTQRIHQRLCATAARRARHRGAAGRHEHARRARAPDQGRPVRRRWHRRGHRALTAPEHPAHWSSTTRSC